MRAFAAVNWKHGPLQLELGYTNVLLRRGDAVPLKLLHVAMVMVIWTMPGTLMEDSTVRP